MRVKPSEGKIVGFEPLKEGFSKYLLEDGNTIQFKIVLLKVKRTDKKNPDGTPVYSFNTQIVPVVTTSDERRWREKE